MTAGDKYTDPKLRDQVKKEVQDSDKGGAPGQWSARKAQFMASEYKKRGGGYTTDKEHGQDESGKNLDKWTEEEWQTKEGSGNAKQSDGTQQRYLPKKAWENMDEDEKDETEQKKQAGSKQGKQFVGNAEGAKEKRKQVSEEGKSDKPSTRSQGKGQNGSQQKESGQKQQPPKTDGNAQPKSGTRAAAKQARDNLHEADELDEEIGADDIDDDAAKDPGDEEEAFEDDGEADEPSDDDMEDEEQAKEDDEVAEEEDAALGQDEPGDEDADEEMQEAEAANEDQAEQYKLDQQDEAEKQKPRGTKRSSPASEQPESGSPEKKVRQTEKNSGNTIGSKHDSAESDAPAGNKDRLPEKGQSVSWKALPGWVYGKVVEIVWEDKTVQGQRAKGSKNDPRIVLKAESGKICVHKPEGVFFK